jgi:acetylglutamate kinase
LDVDDDTSVIPVLNRDYYQELRLPRPETGTSRIFAGMIPKLDNAFAALNSGVKRVVIGKAEELDQLISGNSGTSITDSPSSSGGGA